MSLQDLLLAVATASWLAVAVAVFRVFARRGPATAGLWALRLVVVAADVAGAWAIAVADPPPAWRSGAGIALLLLSDALFAWSVVATRRRPLSIAFGADAPEPLLSRGPFALVRHPFYTSYLLSYLAPLVATLNPALLVPLLAVALLLLAAAHREEARLRAGPQGAEYAAYAARTGMILPSWRGLVGGGPPR